MKSSPAYSHAIATPSPREQRDSRSFSHGISGNEMSRVRIGDGELCNEPDDRNEAHSVQRPRYIPTNPDHAVALRLLKSVPAPLSVKRISRALAWPEHRAAKYLRIFAAKGELVATGKGHVWTR